MMPQPFDLKPSAPHTDAVAPAGGAGERSSGRGRGLGASSSAGVGGRFGTAAPPGVVWAIAIVAALAGAVLPTPWWQVGIAAAAVLACAFAARITAPALRLGLWAAVIFIGLRVAYRVLFTSTVAPAADAVLLLDLPVITLAGPLRGIALLGPLTLDALLATLADASRFAVVFIVFGAANALADARTVLARAPRLLRPIATVLALALGLVPALLASLHRVSFAARLRGERRGPRLLVPVFEQAVERATALGASMALRGFGSPPDGLSVRAEAETDSAALSARRLSVQHGSKQTLCAVNLDLRAGELTVVTGPTGSGKSTLLAALAGLAPAYTGGEVTGEIVVSGLAPGYGSSLGAKSLGSEPSAGRARPHPAGGHLHEQLPAGPSGVVGSKSGRPARPAAAVAFVPQRVEHSFLAETVSAELAFAPRHRGATEAEIDVLVDHGLARFGLADLAERDPSTLSAGEATRVAIAAAVLTRPRVLLLDEPIADLDPDSIAAVLDALRGLLADGCAVLVAEHRAEALAGLETEVPVRHRELREGRLLQGQVPARLGSSPEPARRPAVVPPAELSESFTLARDLIVERNGRRLFTVDDLTTRGGEALVLSGANGTGKTSLLEDIALSVRGVAEIALVPHRVDDLLIRDTLAAECRFADRRARAQKGTTLRRFEGLVQGSILEVETLGATHPRDLSAGTRLALAIAVQLAHEPRMLLLDEPTRGLDAAARARVAELLAGVADEGRAVLLATHDPGFAKLLESAGAAVRHLRIADGRLV